MKKIFTFLLCFATLSVFAQITVDDFEGAAKGWGSVEGLTEVQNNAYKTGITYLIIFFTQSVRSEQQTGQVLFYTITNKPVIIMCMLICTVPMEMYLI